MNVADLQVIVAQEIQGSPHGVQAKFIKLDEKWGLKLFYSKVDRDFAHDLQKRCYDVGWAPEVGDKIDMPESEEARYNGDEYRYGYITEIVETLPNCMFSREFENQYGEEAYQDALTKKRKWNDEHAIGHDCDVEKWRDEIHAKTGWWFNDNHLWNWGRKDGKWIPIDFGR